MPSEGCQASRIVIAVNGFVDDPVEFQARSEIACIKASVTDKATWMSKVYDDVIVEKWLRETLCQAFDDEWDDDYDDDPESSDESSGNTPWVAPPGSEALTGLFRQAIAELRASRYFHRFGVAYGDGLIGSELRDTLRAQFQAMATTMRPDWHPGSRETVLDLIHPSLFPFVNGRSIAFGRSQRTPYPIKLPPLKMRPCYEGSELDRFAHCILGDETQSEMQWLPAEVDVDKYGKARFISYINNLPASSPLNDTLGHVLTSMLPLFEDVVTSPNAPTRVSLRGRRLQVIVKAANYVLEQGKTYQGSWHVEGMLHERIVAAGIYYYDQQGAIGANGVRFRRLRNRNIAGHEVQEYAQEIGEYEGNWRFSKVAKMTHDVKYRTHPEVSGNVDQGGDEDGDDSGYYEVPTGFTHTKYQLNDITASERQERLDERDQWKVRGKTHSMRNFVDLDAIATPEGRVLVFKNSLLHQVQRLYNAGSDVAQRKILVFWLVHPDYPIVSTADVAPQQWEEVAPEIAVPLALRLGRNPRLAWFVLQFAKWGFRRSEAEKLRKTLMQERAASGSSVGQLFTSDITKEYSYCEH